MTLSKFVFKNWLFTVDAGETAECEIELRDHRGRAGFF